MLHQNFETWFILFVLAIFGVGVAKKFQKIYPIALVILGAIIGLVYEYIHIDHLEHLVKYVTEDENFEFAIIGVFLAVLLGDAGIKTEFKHMKENKGPVLALAIGGTLLSFVIVGLTSNLLLGLSVQVAFTFASLMSATDPLSVLSIFKTMGVNHRLSTIIEGESLSNDGIAVVLFVISTAYLESILNSGFGGAIQAILIFCKFSIGGTILGLLFGYGCSICLKWFDDYPYENLLTLAFVYGSFLTAEKIGVSGVIAVLVASLVIGDYGSKIGMSPTTRMNINSFWDTLALFANSLVFLMVGIEIARINIKGEWKEVILAVVIVIIARSLAVYVSLAFAKNIPNNWKHLLNWGGLKGSLSVALALSLPHTFPGREKIILLTFSVVLFSLIVQGLTIKPLIHFLGIKSTEESETEYNKTLAKNYRLRAALNRLKELHRKEGMATDVIYNEKKKQLEEQIEQNRKELELLYEKYPHLKENLLQDIDEQLLYAEYDAIEELSKKHILNTIESTNEKEEIIEKLQFQKEKH